MDQLDELPVLGLKVTGHGDKADPCVLQLARPVVVGQLNLSDAIFLRRQQLSPHEVMRRREADPTDGEDEDERQRGLYWTRQRNIADATLAAVIDLPFRVDALVRLADCPPA